MKILRQWAWIGALALALAGTGQASAAEPAGDCGRLTCFRHRSCCYEPVTCCAPTSECQRRRGPIRRLLHRLFHHRDCCPPAAVPVIPEGPVAVPPPPVQILPPAGAPTIAPPSAPPLPPPGTSSLAPAAAIPPAVGSSYHAPATPQPPVRFERLASYRR